MCKSQKYSITRRPNKPLAMVTPGPDLYFSEKALNKSSHQKSAPSYSIGIRSKPFEVDNTPGKHV